MSNDLMRKELVDMLEMIDTLKEMLSPYKAFQDESLFLRHAPQGEIDYFLISLRRLIGYLGVVAFEKRCVENVKQCLEGCIEEMDRAIMEEEK